MTAGPDTAEPSDDEDKVVKVAEVAVCPVSNSEALAAFEKCLVWLRHQEEATAVNTATLLHLRELAAEKRELSRKQSSIFSFFQR